MTKRTLWWCLLSFVAAAACARGTRQPHMNQALDLLGDARQQLEGATHDKGGHRVKAIDEIRLAEDEVRKGIEFDEAH